MKYTEEQLDEIRAAAAKVMKDYWTDQDVSPEAFAQDVIAALTARKLRDDCPVIVDHGDVKGLIVYASGIAKGDCNIRALITEDTVMEWSWSMLCEADARIFQLKIDAYRYGSE